MPGLEGSFSEIAQAHYDVRVAQEQAALDAFHNKFIELGHALPVPSTEVVESPSLEELLMERRRRHHKLLSLGTRLAEMHLEPVYEDDEGVIRGLDKPPEHQRAFRTLEDQINELTQHISERTRQ